MKPIDRIERLRSRLDELTGVPIMIEGTEAQIHDTDSVNYRNAAQLAELVTEARWLIAFTGKLVDDGVEWTYEQAGRERDAMRPHESEPSDPLSQQFFEGSAFVRDRVRDWLHNDPDLWTGPDNPYAVSAGAEPVPGVSVLEFDDEGDGQP